MSLKSIRASTGEPYARNCQIASASGELSITIKTEKLNIQSVCQSEMDNLVAERTQVDEEICSRVKGIWTKRWSNKIPFSPLAIFEKESGDFLGHIGLEPTHFPGETELVCSISESEKYGADAVQAVVSAYIPAIVKQKYALEGVPLQNVHAWVPYDKPAIWSVLQNAGMRCIGHSKDPVMYHYSLDLTNSPLKTRPSKCIIL